jgi:hypothetical protein
MYILCIYHAKSLLSCPYALGSLRPGLPSEPALLSFGHREAAHARLGPSKVPQLGIDLVNMAAPPRDWASTTGIGTMGASQCGNDLPGFGVHSVTQKLRAYNIMTVLKIMKLKLYKII